ncbi:MAG: PAS domain S-box protein [Deltaproteobacteria bacterium]|nr:PAS domain S-box protein [Deltaproteobacteria bacterium]
MKLTFKLLAGIFAGTAVVILAISLLSFTFTQSALEKSIGKNQLGIAGQTMTQIDAFLYERYIDIQAIAGETFLQDLLKGGGKQRKTDTNRLKELTVVTGPWDILYVTDRKGKILLSTSEEEIGKSIGHEPHSFFGFREAINGKTHHSDLVISDDTKKPTVIYTIPVRDKEDPKQAVIGVVGGHLDWPAVEEILENIPSPSPEAHVMLVDSEGSVIGCNLPNREMVGLNLKESSVVRDVLSGGSKTIFLPESESMLGEASLVSYVPQAGRLSYKSNGWGLILEVPRKTAIAGASKTALRLVLLLLPVLLFMAGGSVWFVWRSILKPVSLLTKTTAAIRSGDLSRRAPIMSQDEIGDLGATFNTMMDRLKTSHEGLKQKVEERTKEVAASEAKYKTMIDTCPDAVLIADVEAKTIRYANPAACRLLGYDQEELILKNVADLHPKEALPHVMEAIEGSSQQESVTAEEIPFLRKDGGIVVMEVSGAAIKMDGRMFSIGFFRDLTERKQAEAEREKLEKQLAASQKMESIGRLTGGVAHDFNNLLGIITGNCELALNETKPDGPVGEYLKDIKEAGERAAVLTRQLLAFSRKQVLQLRVFSMNDVLIRADRLLQRLIGENIQLLTLPAPDLALVKADPGQIEQVILNLATNARDAMPHGGKLILETKNATLDEEYTSRHPEIQPGTYSMLAVSDNGLGMDEKTMSHLFEPFYTTKGKGKGTGLGLSMVYGIVKQSGGHISVHSTHGQGTSFKVYLPQVEGAAQPLRAEKTAPAILTGSETVMVVEDEEKLRKFICRVLGEKGYAVLEASSGDEALRTVGSSGKPIALLITDVIMPGMSGREVAERMILKKPGIKILYISGFTENAIAHHGVLDEGTHFLGKPFTPETLLHQVREIIES